MDKISCLAIGSDHAGYELKEQLKKYLAGRGFRVDDMGPYSPEPVDYPDFGSQVAALVCSGKAGRGILICGSGIGMSITANRFPGVRAALCLNPELARLSREHNDSNILVLAARFTEPAVAEEITRVWLDTAFSGDERHARRLAKIDSLKLDPCK
jgi:RpiB/LacA/LacB family sugar-phosphate isomerase